MRNIMGDVVKRDRAVYLKETFFKDKTKEQELMKIKLKSFHTGEPLDLKVLLSITEFEKHKYVIYYNFAKCKVERLNAVLKLTSKFDDIATLELETLSQLLIREQNNYSILQRFKD